MDPHVNIVPDDFHDELVWRMRRRDVTYKEERRAILLPPRETHTRRENDTEIAARQGADEGRKNNEGRGRGTKVASDAGASLKRKRDDSDDGTDLSSSDDDDNGGSGNVITNGIQAYMTALHQSSPTIDHETTSHSGASSLSPLIPEQDLEKYTTDRLQKSLDHITGIFALANLLRTAGGKATSRHALYNFSSLCRRQWSMRFSAHRSPQQRWCSCMSIFRIGAGAMTLVYTKGDEGRRARAYAELRRAKIRGWWDGRGERKRAQSGEGYRDSDLDDLTDMWNLFARELASSEDDKGAVSRRRCMDIEKASYVFGLDGKEMLQTIREWGDHRGLTSHVSHASLAPRPSISGDHALDIADVDGAFRSGIQNLISGGDWYALRDRLALDLSEVRQAIADEGEVERYECAIVKVLRKWFGVLNINKSKFWYPNKKAVKASWALYEEEKRTERENEGQRTCAEGREGCGVGK